MHAKARALALSPRRPSAHLVFNQSRVFAARVHASTISSASTPATPAAPAAPATPAGATSGVEVLFLSPLSHSDPASALASPAAGQLWRAMVRAPLARGGGEAGGGGTRLEVRGAGAAMVLEVEEVLAPWIEVGEPDGVEAAVRLSLAPPAAPAAAAAAAPTPPAATGAAAPEETYRLDEPAGLPLSGLLELLGQTPLPPYLQRAALPSDVGDYQTVYAAAAQTGSVAAPTAGLHFTPDVLAALVARGVASSFVSLHVGAGTFKPVTSPTLGGHEMHAEPFSITVDALDALAASATAGRPLVPVGTTSARLLESLYWLAAARGFDDAHGSDLGHLGQWDAYRGMADSHAAATASDADAGAGADPRLPLSRAAALTRLRTRAEAAGGRLYGRTSLCIAPGYAFALCDGLVTNFHAPDSTLMALVSALLGGAPRARALYAHAVAQRYRFLSYGDSSFLARACDA